MRDVSEPGDNVLQFRLEANPTNCLTSKDKEAVEKFSYQAKSAGYGRLAIHLTEPSDGLSGRDYVAAYRAGQVWSAWCFARNGSKIFVWALRHRSTRGPSRICRMR
jgi:hypothetical protein